MANASGALTIAGSPNHTNSLFLLTPPLTSSLPTPLTPSSSRGASSGARVPLSAVLTPASMFALGVLGNTVAIAALAQTPRGRKDGAFYALVCGLAVTDLLGTCLSSPVVIAGYVRGGWPGGDALCGFFAFTLLFFGAAGISILCAMSVERYLAINHPYVYNRYVDARRARAALAALYVINGCLCALPCSGVGRSVAQFPGTWCFLDWRSKEPKHAAYNFVYGGYSAALIAITVFCNIAVCRALLRMKRRTFWRSSVASVSVVVPPPPSSCSSACTRTSRISAGPSSSPSVATAFARTVRLSVRGSSGDNGGGSSGGGTGSPLVCPDLERGGSCAPSSACEVGEASSCRRCCRSSTLVHARWSSASVRSPRCSTQTWTCGSLTLSPTRPQADRTVPLLASPLSVQTPPRRHPSPMASQPDSVTSVSLSRCLPLSRTPPGLLEQEQEQLAKVSGVDADHVEIQETQEKEKLMSESQRESRQDATQETAGSRGEATGCSDGQLLESSRRGRWHRRGLWALGPSAAEVQMLWLLLVMTVVFLVCSIPLVVRIFVNQLHRPPVERHIPHNRDILAIRLASFNPILDPWVYILCRRGLLGRLVRLCRRLTRKHTPATQRRARGTMVSWRMSVVQGDGDDGDGEDDGDCGAVSVHRRSAGVQEDDGGGCGCTGGSCATTNSSRGCSDCGHGCAGAIDACASVLCWTSVAQADGCGDGGFATTSRDGCQGVRGSNGETIHTR
uniref:Prostaglandin E2 receptor EP4 subtype-like n=1 Tax=Petromyzon marinus TaxID=7757 RepID=A0AAJ7T5N7_PETMA|nr:prostaglandin E2 receptor EP4 subtype-like [Petromyzon marinus]